MNRHAALDFPAARPLALTALGLAIPLALALALASLRLRATEEPAPAPPASGPPGLFARDNLVAWCIVPFDARKRGPEERAAMLARLGFKRFAYDWRAEHLPSFDAECEALARRGIVLDAVWFPAALNDEARALLEVLRRRGLKTQLWVMMGDPRGGTQEEKVDAAAAALRPVAEEAGKIGCTVGLYNHGGWFGDPENQLAIIARLGLKNLGIVYNLHHGHEHLDRFPELLRKMQPRLLALNLNGMVREGERTGRKILPLGQGNLDRGLLAAIKESGYRGPIGILGHTDDDAEERLRDNLDGLDWLLPQLDGRPAGPRPKPRTPVSAAPPDREARAGDALPAPAAAPLIAYDPDLARRLAAEARERGDARRGAAVFADARFACISCHRVGPHGGGVGPELTAIAKCLTPEAIAESVLWPAREVKEPYRAWMVLTRNGEAHRGYALREEEGALVLREPAGAEVRIAAADIAERQETGTLMPDGLASAMSAEERRDVVRFLLDLGGTGDGTAHAALAHAAPVAFAYDRAPLEPERWPSWTASVNRDRLYDFYAKEAAHFLAAPSVPHLLPPYPGIDGGKYGHWGNQDEGTWRDDRWNRTDLGAVLAGVFHGAGATVAKGVCVRFGERGEMAACFNPQTLSYEAVWRGGFVKFSAVRHGFLDGLLLDGTPLPRPERRQLAEPREYHGFYRHGARVIFAYRLGGEEFLDSPWVEGGEFKPLIGPAAGHPLAELTRGGPRRWPEELAFRGELGRGEPYAIDTIPAPYENPWRAPLFFGGHDFLPDGAAVLSTIQGDVWRVDGLDAGLERVRWRRIASGLHQALGVVVAEGIIHVLGRDQITRLHDLNGDGEADFHQCFANAYVTSTSGHDYICGLERDGNGNFYTVSGNQGLIRIGADGKRVEVLATGLRNPDGLGILPLAGGAAATSDGQVAITVPASEGEWTPASMVCEVRAPAGAVPAAWTPPHFGYGGPRGGKPPALPLVYLPRGLDNSSGGQVAVAGDRWGPLAGLAIHFSYGAGSHFLLLRDEVDGQPQGTVVPLLGEFLSSPHRGRFHPLDGQLYVSGMGGWGAYTVADGSFQRVRYTGGRVELPRAVEAHENGVRIAFTEPIDREAAGNAGNHFAQAWNYAYSSGYGSPELSARHPGTPGHDPLAIASAHVSADGRSLFLEIPELQPVNQLHLHVRTGAGRPHDIFTTVHRLRPPYTAFPGHVPRAKVIAAHPLLADLHRLERAVPNPWRRQLPQARAVLIEAGKNLTFATRSFTARAGEAIALTLKNPDVVPHNWALAKPGSLARVGDLANRIIAEPDAVLRHYVPRTDDVLAYTDVVPPGESFTIHFRVPEARGRYPYLCTFPGHWMVMNGEMVVE